MVLPLLAMAGAGGIAQGIGSIFGARAQVNAAQLAFERAQEYGQQAFDRQRAGFTRAGDAQVHGAQRAGNALANGARRAGQAGVNAANQQLDMAGNVLDRQTAQFQPYATSGQNALAAMNYEMGLGQRPNGYAGFTATPGYDFRLNQGLDAITGNAAATGSSLSGAAAKALMGYGQNLASEEYGTYMDRLGGMTDQGLNASGAIGNALANYGQTANAAIGARGDARQAMLTGIAAARGGQAANIADARANQFTNIGNAGANSSYYIGSAGQQAATDRGNAISAGWAGVTNAFNDTMSNMAGIQAYQNRYGAPAPAPVMSTSPYAPTSAPIPPVRPMW